MRAFFRSVALDAVVVGSLALLPSGVNAEAGGRGRSCTPAYVYFCCPTPAARYFVPISVSSTADATWSTVREFYPPGPDSDADVRTADARIYDRPAYPVYTSPYDRTPPRAWQPGDPDPGPTFGDE